LVALFIILFGIFISYSAGGALPSLPAMTSGGFHLPSRSSPQLPSSMPSKQPVQSLSAGLLSELVHEITSIPNYKLSYNCTRDIIVMYNSQQFLDAWTEYLVYLGNCYNDAIGNYSINGKCEASTNSSQLKTACKNANGTLCTTTMKSTGNAVNDIDFSFYLCLPKSCNKTDVNHIASGLTSVNETTNVTFGIKCGGIQAWIIVVIIVVILVAILIAIIVIVMVLRKKKPSDTIYTPLGTGAPETYGSNYPNTQY